MIGSNTERKDQDFIFPEKDKMSYFNPIVGFQHAPKCVFHGFNYILKDGNKSDLELNYNGYEHY